MDFDGGRIRSVLDLDTDPYAQGMLRAESIARLFPDVVTSFLANPLLGAIDAAKQCAGAFIDMFDSVTKNADNMGDLAASVGVNVEVMTALGSVAEMAGSNTNETAMAFTMLGKSVGAAMAGSAADIASFRRASIAFMDAAGNARPLEDIMLDVADALDKLPPGAQRTQLAMDLLGRSGTSMIPVLAGGSKALREQMNQAREYGAVVTEVAVDTADKWEDSMGEMQLAWTGLKQTLVTPIRESLLPMMTDLRDWVRDNQPEIRKSIEQIGQTVGAMTQELKQWTGTMQATLELAERLARITGQVNQAKPGESGYAVPQSGGALSQAQANPEDAQRLMQVMGSTMPQFDLLQRVLNTSLSSERIKNVAMVNDPGLPDQIQQQLQQASHEAATIYEPARQQLAKIHADLAKGIAPDPAAFASAIAGMQKFTAMTELLRESYARLRAAAGPSPFIHEDEKKAMEEAANAIRKFIGDAEPAMSAFRSRQRVANDKAKADAEAKSKADNTPTGTESDFFMKPPTDAKPVKNEVPAGANGTAQTTAPAGTSAEATTPATVAVRDENREFTEAWDVWLRAEVLRIRREQGDAAASIYEAKQQFQKRIDQASTDQLKKALSAERDERVADIISREAGRAAPSNAAPGSPRASSSDLSGVGAAMPQSDDVLRASLVNLTAGLNGLASEIRLGREAERGGSRPNDGAAAGRLQAEFSGLRADLNYRLDQIHQDIRGVERELREPKNNIVFI